MSLHPLITFTRATLATYFDRDGVLQTAPSNTPRWEYDPVSHVLRGMLIEEQRRNVLLYSASMTSNWPVAEVTFTYNAGIAPDGTNTATRIAETATSGAHYTGGDTTAGVTASAMLTFSVYAKAQQNRWLQLGLDDTSVGSHATFDLQTGTISGPQTVRGSATLGGAIIQAVGNGFYRCSITNTAGTTTTPRALFVLANAAAPAFAIGYAGSTANGLLIWGAQLEQGAYPTSYISTTSAAVTRAADIPVMPSWFNTSAGSMSVEWITTGWVVRNAGLTTLDDGAGNRANSIDCFAYPNATASQLITSAVRVGNTDSNYMQSANLTIQPMSVNQTAISWNSSTMLQAYNGSVVSAPVASGVPAGITRLVFGNGYGGVGSLGGYLRKVTYWSRVLSNVELQAATLDPFDLNLMVPGSLDPRITFTRASIGTYFDVNGVMQTAAIDTPRWDYDPVTHALRGLLLEDARTNSVFPSVLGGAWTNQALPVSLGGSVTLPDGTTSTTSLLLATDTTTSVRSYANTNIAITPSVTYTVSAFFKRDMTNAHIQVNTLGVAQVASVAYYDLTNGTAVVGIDLIAGLTAKSASITPIANGWYRASFTFTNTTNNLVTVFFGPCMVVSATGADNRAYPGVVGRGVYVWGVQLEQGPMATSYIPTTSAAVTRMTDTPVVSSLPGINNVTNSLATDFMVPYSSMVAGTAYVSGQLDDGLSYNHCYILRNQFTNVATINVFNGNAIVGAATAGTFTPYTVMKQVAAFDGRALTGATAVNGQTPVPFTFTGAPAPMVRLVIGLGRSSAVNGWMQRVRYWPRVLSNSEMQAVTTLDTPRTPSLELDFLTPGSLDARISFTRAGTVGTYFDSAGVMRNAAINSIKNSTMIGAVAGSPGTDPTGWTVAAVGGLTKTIVGVGTESGIAYIDYRFQAAAATGANLNFVMSPASTSALPASAASVYNYSFYMALVAGSVANLTTGWSLVLDQFDAAGASLGALTSTAQGFVPFALGNPLTKTRVTYAFNATVANTAFLRPFFRFAIQAGAVDFTIRIGAPQLELGSAATIFIPTTTAANSGPRWDYDPASKVLKGLLIEEARTNLILNSQFAANWAAGDAGITPNAVQSPDGGTTAAIVQEGGSAASSHYITQSVAKAASSITYAISVFLKSGTGNRNLQFQIDDGGANGIQFGLNPATGAIVASLAAFGTGWSGTAHTYTWVGNGWGRIAFTVTTGTQTGIRTVLMMLNGTQAIYNGDNASNIRMYGYQLEVGVFPSSYIPTTSGAVTRATENCTIPTSSWFNPTTSTLRVDCMVAQSPNPSVPNARTAASLSDGTAANIMRSFIQLDNSANSAIGTIVSSVSTIGTSLGAPAANTMAKLIGAWNGVSATGVLTGGPPVSQSVGMPTGINVLTLGAVYTGSASRINGWVSTIKYWPRALSNAEMQVATLPPTTPSLELDFLTPGSLDGRIAFTRASTATYFDNAGVIQTAAIDTPRWDYDPATKALRGLLLEDARTNLMLQSGDFTNVAWTKGSGATLVAGVPGPNGATTGSGLISANGTIGYVGQNYNATAGVPITMSCYVKAGSMTTVQLYMPSSWWIDGINRFGTFELVGNGSVQSVTGATMSGAIQSVGNGWYRISMTGTPDKTALTLTQFGRAGANGDGVTVQHYVFGAQLEVGDFPTSYIATTSAAVTRIIDSCFIPPANMGWFNGTGGSWLAEFDYLDPTPFNIRIIGRPNFIGGQSVASVGSARVCGQYDTVAGINGLSVSEANTTTRHCTTWIAGEAKSCTNGGGIGTSAALTTGYIIYATTGIMLMPLGPAGGTDNANGHFRALRYWPRILTDTEMQTITT